MTLGERVRELRVRRGLSQAALAGDSLSPSYVSLVEAGRRAPTEGALRVIAATLGTSAEYLRTGREPETLEHARLELSFAQLALLNGEAQVAKSRLESLSLERADDDLVVQVRLAQAEAHEHLGELNQAISLLEPLVAQAREQRSWTVLAKAGTALCACYIESGDLTRACEIGDGVLEQLGLNGMESTDEHIRLGATTIWAYHERGDLLFAAHRATLLLQTAETHGSARARGSIYWNAAIVCQSQGRIAQALTLTTRALALLGESETSRDVPRLRLHYAWLLLRSQQPDVDQALEQLALAEPALAATGSVIDLAGCAIERSRAYLHLGDVTGAEQQAHHARALLGDTPRIESADVHVLLGDVALAKHHADQAMRHYTNAADTLALMRRGRAAAAAWRDLARRFAANGQTARAVDAYERAFTELGLPTQTPTTHRNPTATTHHPKERG